MEVVNLKNGVESGLLGSVLAIGNFDGVHIGHQQIIKKVIETAKKNKKPSAVYSFEPHPISFFSPQVKNYRITNFQQKCAILDKLGIDCIFFSEFNEDFSKISAEDFVSKTLKNKLSASAIFTGDDFIFGYNRSGNSSFLKIACKNNGINYAAISEIKNEENRRYSSSSARDFIRSGNLKAVSDILGRNFEIYGKVIEGAKIASQLGYPTANIDLNDYILPKFGVYKVNAKLDSKTYKAIANIGVKPSFNGNKPLLEVHIPNFSENLYGKNIAVELIEFIREEKKFDSIEDLKQQIEKDILLI